MPVTTAPYGQAGLAVASKNCFVAKSLPAFGETLCPSGGSPGVENLLGVVMAAPVVLVSTTAPTSLAGPAAVCSTVAPCLLPFDVCAAPVVPVILTEPMRLAGHDFRCSHCLRLFGGANSSSVGSPHGECHHVDASAALVVPVCRTTPSKLADLSFSDTDDDSSLAVPALMRTCFGHPQEYSRAGSPSTAHAPPSLEPRWHSELRSGLVACCPSRVSCSRLQGYYCFGAGSSGRALRSHYVRVFGNGLARFGYFVVWWLPPW